MPVGDIEIIFTGPEGFMAVPEPPDSYCRIGQAYGEFWDVLDTVAIASNAKDVRRSDESLTFTSTSEDFGGEVTGEARVSDGRLTSLRITRDDVGGRFIELLEFSEHGRVGVIEPPPSNSTLPNDSSTCRSTRELLRVIFPAGWGQT